MDNNWIVMLLAFGLAGLICIFVAVMAVGMVIFFVRRASSAAKQFSYRPAKQGEEYLASASLRPWSPTVWTDLSSHWDGWWLNTTSIGRSDGHAQGIVASLKDPAGPGWIAFTIERYQARSGTVVLKTSQQRVELKVASKSHLDRNIQVVTIIDGVEDGAIAVTAPSCIYHSKDSAAEAHWISEVRRGNERFTLNRLTSREVSYDALTVNGRDIAAITDTWIRYPHPENVNPFHPALQSVVEDATPIEQKVLLIALGLSLYYDSLRNRSYIYDW
ncbi:MAG: hypothetical protein HY258_00950 [Chloroflexi bacterium]|nr:hypothetical protein [Chloroflexota bacterium]